jgi:two-component sensor histidine kinase
MCTIAVRHEPASAALVRHSIAADLAAHAVLPSSIADVVLVASELVGNAVVHATPGSHDELDVDWDIYGTSVMIRVSDAGPEVPRPRISGPTEPGGRGLSIVAALALDWGFAPSPIGKQVWARVPIRWADERG